MKNLPIRTDHSRAERAAHYAFPLIALPVLMLILLLAGAGTAAAEGDNIWELMNFMLKYCADEMCYANMCQNPGTAVQAECGKVTLKQDITIDDGGLLVEGTVTLDLEGNSITSRHQHPIITVDGGNLTLMDSSSGKTGRIIHNGSAYDDDYGGVLVDGGSFTMNGGTISGNIGDRSGGVRVEGGSFTMNGGTISGNGDSGVYVGEHGAFIMEDGTISGNRAYSGGGVRVEGGIFTMSGGTISGNTAGGHGGGVCVDGGTFNLSGGTISGNIGSRGGGVYIKDGGTFNLSLSGSPEISGNFYEKLNSGTMSDLWLDCPVINVSGELPDNKKAQIGIAYAVGDMAEGIVFTAGLNGKGSPDYFFSDTSERTIAEKDGEAVLVSLPAAPTFTPAGGDYIGPQTVSISCTNANASIYYETGGSDPTTGSTLYTAPFTIIENTTVKAIAVNNYGFSGDVAAAEYTIMKEQTVTPPAAVQNLTYKGKPLDLISAAVVTEGNTADGSISYSLDNNKWSTSLPQGTDAGPYSIYYKVAGNDSYIEYVGPSPVSVTIGQAEDPAVITAAAEVIRGGNTVDLSKNVNGAAGAVRYEILSGANGCSVDETTGLLTSGDTAGSVTVTVTIGDTQNYTGRSENITVTVKEKNSGKLSVTQEGMISGGMLPAPSFTKPADTISAPSVSYSGTLADGSPYDPASGDPTEAGSYTVTVICETKDTIYTGTAGFTIIQAARELTLLAPSFGTVSYGYAQPEAGTVTVANGGNSEAKISSAALSGDGASAFILNSTDGITVPAGATDSTAYTVRPKAGLDAGTYKAVFTVTYNDGKKTADLSFTVEKAEDPAVISGAAKASPGGSTVDLSENVSGAVGTVSYAVTGDTKGCSVDAAGGILTSGNTTGTVIVTVTVADSKNYTGKSGTITVTIGESQVDYDTKTLTEVPEALKSAYPDVEALKQYMQQQLKLIVEGESWQIEQSVFHDVELKISLDGGKTWKPATADNFPEGGLEVILPYPEGTGKDTHNFSVSHMFTVTSDRLGTKAGEVEYPKVTAEDDGLHVVLKGLSPVAVAFSQKETESDEFKVNVNFVFIKKDGSRRVPFDIREGTLKPVLSIKDGKKVVSQSKALAVEITAGAKESGPLEASFNKELVLKPGKYTVSVSGLPQEMEKEIPESSSKDAAKYKLTAKAEINVKDGEPVITVYLTWDDGKKPEVQVVYPLPEDEIGAYWLRKDGTKEYLLFHTYDICMQWLGKDELCAGPERCFHKDGK